MTPTDGILVIMEGSLLSSFFYTTMDCSLVIREGIMLSISVTPMDGSLVIMEGSLLLSFLFLQGMVPLSLLKVVCYLCFSNG